MAQALDKQDIQGIVNACYDATNNQLSTKSVGTDSGVRQTGRSIQSIWRAVFDPTDNTIRVVS